jgi:membrane-associated HD superfamily phosphohydrolase
MYLAPILLLHQQNKSITFPIYCALLLATIAFINLLLISIIELQWDEEMDNTSLVRVLGLEYSKSLFLSLQLICTLSITVLLFLAPTAYAPMLLSYLMISLGHLFIYTKRATLNHNLAYRKLSEALFWLPFMAYFFYL